MLFCSATNFHSPLRLANVLLSRLTCVIGADAPFNCPLAVLEVFINSSEIFINALEEIVEQTLYPNKPRFAFGRSVIAAQEAGKVYEEMEETYEKLLALVSKDGDEVSPSAIDELKAAQEAFQKYLEAETEFEETLVNPGSGNTLRAIDSHIMKSLCQHRIIRLNEVLEIFSYQDQN